MRKNLLTIGIGLLLGMTAIPLSGQVSNEDGVNQTHQRRDNVFIPGQVIVKFKDGSTIQVYHTSRGQFRAANISSVDKLLRNYGVNDMEKLFPAEVAKPKAMLRRKMAPNGTVVMEKNLDKVFWIKTNSQSSDSTLMLIEQLKSLPEVEYAEPNYYVSITANSSSSAYNRAPQRTMVVKTAEETTAKYICPSPNNNPLYSEQYGIPQQNIHQLWNKPIINKRRPVIAIIDTGVDITHPDLTSNIWTNPKELDGENGYDDDNNGYKDDINGWNFVEGNNDVADLNKHGTHVAGIAAASDNTLGIVGANPLARIMPVRVLNEKGSGDAATVARGIVYAAENGADILNLSLGGPVLSTAQKEAIDKAYQSSIIVAAAGNSGMSIYKQYTGITYLLIGSGRNYPGAYHLVLGVEATKQGGQLASYSNFDPDGPVYSEEGIEGCNYEVQVAGSDIMSVLPDGKYGQLSGTSMATPLMAGAISALMMVKDYSSRDALYGDLIHLNADFAKIYSNSTSRKPKLDLVAMVIDDNAGNGNGSIDVGETVNLIPTLRNTWSEASGVQLKLSVEDKYKNSVTIQNPVVNLGNKIPVYGCQTALQPFKVKFSSNIDCGDEDTSVKFTLEMSCNESSDVEKRDVSLSVNNMVELFGLISENRTLTADRVYHVTDNIGIMEGATLTIEPGTRLEFDEDMGISSFGRLVANGLPGKPIIFTGHNGVTWAGIKSHASTGAHTHAAALYTNDSQTLFTLLPTEATPYKFSNNPHISGLTKTIYYANDGDNPYKIFYLKDYIKDFTADMTDKQGLLTDPNYLTAATLQMLGDWETYWSQYPTQKTEDNQNKTTIDADFFSWSIYDNPRDTISFCKIDGYNDYGTDIYYPYMKDCVILPRGGLNTSILLYYIAGVRNNIEGGDGVSDGYNLSKNLSLSNIVNNRFKRDNLRASSHLPRYSHLVNNNYFNNSAIHGKADDYYQKEYWLANNSSSPNVDKSDSPSYLGTSRKDIVRSHIYEIGNAPNTFGQIDLDNMRTTPIAEAHGIVWKVVVNGKDAQDEYEELAPLGVGKHKFDVYFNRPMNKEITPQISFGLEEPYTQIEVNEDGRWNNEGTIYTAYKTITGKTCSDGVNRIYVYGAEDNEYFEIPYEKTRFNVQVNAAGSMATGFAAEPAMGRVNLTWHNEENDFEDAMGFNIYRFTEEQGMDKATRINKKVLDISTTSYTDYDVKPGETYYYMYKVLSTDLQEFDVSNVVAAKPLTSAMGDANGSGDVDVSDVITTVNYAAGMEPKPFIFEAADMNKDLAIDILDVIGIIQKILHPEVGVQMMGIGDATYSIEDGTLYIETPVELAGVQVQISNAQFIVASDLDGFEQVSAWLSDNDLLFLAYNMNGKVLCSGKHALLHIGDGQITSIRLSDSFGRGVKAIGDETTAISRLGSEVMTVKGVYDLQGRKLTGNKSQETKLKKGVYIINGQKVVK